MIWGLLSHKKQTFPSPVGIQPMRSGETTLSANNTDPNATTHSIPPAQDSYSFQSKPISQVPVSQVPKYSPLASNMMPPSSSSESNTTYQDPHAGMPQVTNLDPQGMAQAMAPRRIFQGQSPAGFALTGWQYPNGHKLFIEQRPETHVVSTRTFVNAGSVLENSILTPQQNSPFGLPSGIAHLDEHLHFVAHANHPTPNAWIKEVEHDGAQPNASTDHEVIQHELTFHQENLPKMLALHMEEVLQPVYSPQTLYQEKRNVLAESCERMKAPEVQGQTKLYELLFQRPHFQTHGLPSDILRITPEDVQTYYRHAYQPENLTTVISGNVNPQEVASLLAPLVAQNPNRPESLPQGKETLKAVQAQALKYQQPEGKMQMSVYTDPQLQQAFLQFGFRAPALTSPKDRAAMECLLTYLGGDSQSPLPAILEERLGLISNLDMEYAPLKKDGSVLFQCYSDPQHVSQAGEAFRNALTQYSHQQLCPILLDNVKQRLKTHFNLNQQDVYNATMQMGSEATAGSMDYWLHYPQWIDSITPEDVQRVAKTYLRPEQFAMVVGLPGKTRGFLPTVTLDAPAPSISPLKGLDTPSSNPFNATHSGSVTPKIPAVTKFQGILNPNSSGFMPEATSEVATSQGVTQPLTQTQPLQHSQATAKVTQLANGMKAHLIYQPDAKDCQLTLSLPIGTNTLPTPLLQPALLNCSPVSRSVQTALAERGIQISIANEGERVQLVLNGPKGDEIALLGLGYQLLKQPLMDEKVYQMIQNTFQANLRTAESDPDVQLEERLKQHLFGQQHPFAQTTSQLRQAITAQPMERLKQVFQQSVMNPEAVTVQMVSGHPNEVQTSLLNTAIQHAQWQKPTTQSPWVRQADTPLAAPIPPSFEVMNHLDPLPKLANGSALLWKPDDRLNRFHMVGAWQAPSLKSEDRLAFMLASRTLSGMSGPLFEQLRTQLGLVYSTHSHYSTLRDLGVFTISAEIDPTLDTHTQTPKVQQAITHLQSIVSDMAKTPPNAETFERAKKELLLEMRLDAQSAKGLGGLNMSQLSVGQAPETLEMLEDKLMKLTPEKVQQVAQKVFGTPAQSVIAIAGPTEAKTQLPQATLA
ncbi:MAG: M16 family metallopeptidase [Vampirovibrionales bacterium]